MKVPLPSIAIALLLVPHPGLSQTWSGLEYLGHQNLYPAVLYNDCWGYVAPDGREYALLGVRSGLSIVDITDAPTLKEIGFVPNPMGNSDALSMRVYRHYAYAVNDAGGGINIIDLSGLPHSVNLATTYTALDRSHGLHIDTTDAILYAQYDGNEGVLAFSLADPLHPAPIDSFGAACHTVFARNKRVYVSEGSHGTVAIFDASTFPLPPLLRRVPLPSDGGFAHTSWATEDGQYLFVTYETAGRTSKLWAVTDPDSTYVVGEYKGPTSFPHQVYIKGQYAYFAHYSDGLRIVNIADPADLSEVAYFDSYDPPSAEYHGAWGAFPFFPSGKVILSDIESGLYVVRFQQNVTRREGEGNPVEFTLHQNFPNPFNPSTVISYELSERTLVRMSIYDVLGQEVKMLVEGIRGAGVHRESWDATGMPGGVYFLRLLAGQRQETLKMTLAR